jgi:hypothetical protein
MCIHEVIEFHLLDVFEVEPESGVVVDVVAAVKN